MPVYRGSQFLAIARRSGTGLPLSVGRSLFLELIGLGHSQTPERSRIVGGRVLDGSDAQAIFDLPDRGYGDAVVGRSPDDLELGNWALFQDLEEEPLDLFEVLRQALPSTLKLEGRRLVVDLEFDELGPGDATQIGTLSFGGKVIDERHLDDFAHPHLFQVPGGRNVEHSDPDRDDVAIGFASGRIDQESDSGILEVIGPIDPSQLGAARGPGHQQNRILQDL